MDGTCQLRHQHHPAYGYFYIAKLLSSFEEVDSVDGTCQLRHHKRCTKTSHSSYLKKSHSSIFLAILRFSPLLLSPQPTLQPSKYEQSPYIYTLFLVTVFVFSPCHYSSLMLLKSVVFLAMTAAAVAEIADRTPKVAAVCKKGFVLAADSKSCCPKPKFSLCSCDEEHEKGPCRLPEKEAACATGYFECDAGFGGNCCKNDSFCGFIGASARYVCFE